MIQNYVENVYVINLDRREERWEHVQNQLKKYNIDVERFSAVDGYEHPKKDEVDINPGELGAYLSHMEIIKKAKKREEESIIIFEDDIVFEDGFKWRFKKYYQQLPEDWKMFYLGGNDIQTSEYSENVRISDRVLAIHAYALKSSFYDVILNHLEKKNFSRPIDTSYIDLQQKRDDIFVFKPSIVIQKEGYSDIRSGFRNYNEVLKDL